VDLPAQPLSPLELAAFATGLGSVWLTLRLHVANWPLGIVSVLCFTVLFYDAKLYADAALQVGFAAMGVYGWIRWGAARGAEGVIAVRRSGARECAAAAAVSAAAIAAVALALRGYTDSPLPVPDAAILCLSLLALWAQALRRLECWLVWIAVDVISVPVYWSRDLPLTAALYVVFLVLCLFGLRAWQRQLPLEARVAA
jgi:nicotinamide mononucleotide transporter